MINERQGALDRLCRDIGVSILYVFGSRAHEVANWLHYPEQQLAPNRSDIDIGAHAAPEVFWQVADKVRLALALEDLFGCPRVDLVVLNEADPFVAAEVIRGERLFACDTYEADEYDLYVLRRAGDLTPLERERLELIFGAAS